MIDELELMSRWTCCPGCSQQSWKPAGRPPVGAQGLSGRLSSQYPLLMPSIAMCIGLLVLLMIVTDRSAAAALAVTWDSAMVAAITSVADMAARVSKRMACSFLFENCLI